MTHCKESGHPWQLFAIWFEGKNFIGSVRVFTRAIQYATEARLSLCLDYLRAIKS